MAELRHILERLLDRRDLSEAEAGELLVALTDASTAPAMAGALLAALRAKGVTADEVRGFATTMRRRARRPALPAGPPAIDIVGTGGDASGSFNLSTGASLLVAAMGVRVVKHGNRSISSRSGSADLLECLGLPLPLDETSAGDCLAATGFTFLFAPHYHPSMKEIAPVRRALGVRTVFNMLGPLTNPAGPPFSLIGAYSSDAAKLMAETLSGMPIERVFVIHGDAGWDEPTPIGPFELYDVHPGRFERTQWDFKMTASYDAPYGIRISPVLRHQSGTNFARTIAVPANGGLAASAGITFPASTIYAEAADSRREPNIWVFDTRFERTFTLTGRVRFRGFVDFFNMTNSYSSETINRSTGAAFLRPTAILAPFTTRVGFRLLW